ncbi:hypothetical protein O9992_18955 [Vibrio lentus]|nr:hypothetical protein [Vibrio lentus]
MLTEILASGKLTAKSPFLNGLFAHHDDINAFRHWSASHDLNGFTLLNGFIVAVTSAMTSATML